MVVSDKKKVAIFCAGQWGDCATISSVIKYRNYLWGDSKIVWYIAEDNMDLLKYQDIEARVFPRGYGYPQMVYEENKKLVELGKEPIWEDWLPLVDEKNHMNLELKQNYPSLKDIDYGYFPAPHQMLATKRHGLDYAVCSKKVFGLPDYSQWHPVLNFSDEERIEAFKFIEALPHKKKVLVETFAGSGQSIISEEMITDAMNICREKWTNCAFIFASHKYLRGNEKFPDHFFEQYGVYSAAHFTVRQCGLIGDLCDLIISVSSGITVACSAWGLRPTPIIQFCGSQVCSTLELAKGRDFELVTADDKTFPDAKKEFEDRLRFLLDKYK